MWSVLNENPTREKIIILLKKRGPTSIDDLSRELNITSMGIRQHLLSLERRGLIDYVAKRQGIGRPAFLYRLTGKADELFTKAYDSFLVNVFKDIEKHDGREKIDEIFKWRKNRIFKEAREALAEKKTVQERINGMKDILESEGYLAELDDSSNSFIMHLYNCPIFKLAHEFREACRYDLQMFRELLGKDVNRESCITDGDTSCTYTIPKHIPKT